MPSRDESLSHLSQDRLDESTAEDAGADEEFEPANIDEDAERFCTYRTHRYGQSRDRGRDLLLRMSQALVEDSPGPWHFDFEPLGITRPGAENPDRANTSNFDAPDGEPEGASQADRGRFLMLRNQTPGPGRPWSPPAVSPRSQDASTQRTAEVRWRTIQGGNAQTLDTFAAILAVERSSLEGGYASGTRGPGNPALDENDPEMGT